ncbi:PIN domain-containing protein [soil metagenome]
MIGVDTNVLIRHLVKDDAVQTEHARRFFEERDGEDPAYVSTEVIVELEWVLTRRYKVPRLVAHGMIRSLLNSRDILVEAAPAVRRALADSEDANAELADAIIAHAAIDAGCDGIVTFDRRAQRLPGMLPVG